MKRQSISISLKIIFSVIELTNAKIDAKKLQDRQLIVKR